VPRAASLTEPPAIAAKSYILFNPTTNEVLVQKNSRARLPMASTTKIMTALVVLERAKLTDRVSIPPAAVALGGSSAKLVAGERLTVRDLLTGLMVGSGNDASIALAAHVGGGSEQRFVGLMNAKAQQLGLRDTRFANPHGLDATGHYSTARDLLALGQQAYAISTLRRIVAERTATIPGPNGVGTRSLESENDLLAIDREADGIKTGHTNGAGYTLVAHATRESNGVGLFLVMIGSPSRSQRAQDAKRLFDWGLAQYAAATPITAEQAIVRVPLRDRPSQTVELRAAAPLGVTVKLGTVLRRRVVAPVEIVGAVGAGEPVGEVTLLADGKAVGTTKLVTARAVSGPGIFERIRSGLGRLV
jgi:D-alanyl-D-alanine carboxypeptidase